jgi:L,D-peptidoglycan transpeptidase YkuD (ErfK/YbiS/YcfS/YnhG family)
LRSASTTINRTQRHSDKGLRLRLIAVGITLLPILLGGCSHLDEGRRARSLSKAAHEFFNQEKYAAALRNYEQIMAIDPAVADRILFEMGIIYAYPRNAHKNFQKALQCFQKLLRDYPDSIYRRDSQMMILQIQHGRIKDQTIATLQAQLGTARQDVKSKTREIVVLQDKINTLEAQILALRTEPPAKGADKVLIEKKARRLTLLAKGAVIKTYKIALGGNPVGPKERQGDNKTPEGTYLINSRNRDSAYHLSLRISYPNAKDRMRAKALGVAPGGNIMIHGIKNGLAQIGAAHAAMDWTEGCIAVTNQEMEEIFQLVPNGTLVEIKP